jgi:hypothetical protein
MSSFCRWKAHRLSYTNEGFFLHPIVKHGKPATSTSLDVEIAQLRTELARQNDVVRRLREEIEDEIATWTYLLETGNGETYDSVKRRISRLKGALKYPGIL